jgi:hypothetical protein
MEDRMLRKIYLTDSLQLQNIVKPAGGQEAVMYIVSSITGAFARRLLSAVVWDSHIQTPEIATVISTVSKQNVSSRKKPLPLLKEGEGYLSVTAKPESDPEAPLEVDWHLVVLAYAELPESEDAEEDEEPFLDCSACESASRCFKSDIEA